MKKWLKCFVACMAFVLIGVSSTYSQTVTEGRDTGLSFGKFEVDRVEFFDNFNAGGTLGVGSGFSYTDTTPHGTDTATGGEVKTMRYTENMAVAIIVPILGSTQIDYRVEGRFGTASQWVSIGTNTISTASAVGELVNITSNPEAIRVGIRARGTAGVDEVDVYALLRRLKR